MIIKPYIIVPNLIEQPTWGGHYITSYKNVSHPQLQQTKIGQSYELYEYSTLTDLETTLINDFPLELGDPMNPQNNKKINKSGYALFSLNELIERDPEKVLGRSYIATHGTGMKVLIKFTQAKGNSYQIHVKQKSGKWLPKPESWYYFEPGLLTLGVKKGINWDTFQSVCEQIHELSRDLSSRVTSKTIEVSDARMQLADFISQNNPEEFVHVLETHKDQAIDMSECGVHHSWEEDEKRFPLGNVLYEVQENVYDDVSTIRSFDKGKIQDDGTIRPLQIADYFAYIDRSDETNDPSSHIIQTEINNSLSGISLKKIFNTKRYKMDEIELSGSAKINRDVYYEGAPDGTFHHLFVKNGCVRVTSGSTVLTLSQGYSAFIPANTETYTVTLAERGQNSGTASATILQTYV